MSSYESPTISVVGSVAELTLGGWGSKGKGRSKPKKRPGKYS